MLLKSLEFKNVVGQKVKVVDIPLLEKDSPYQFMIQVRLQAFIQFVYHERHSKKCYSFKEHLKKVMKWPDYEKLFKVEGLKNNA